MPTAGVIESMNIETIDRNPIRLTYEQDQLSEFNTQCNNIPHVPYTTILYARTNGFNREIDGVYD